jgi:hypothetical protein
MAIGRIPAAAIRATAPSISARSVADIGSRPDPVATERQRYIAFGRAYAHDGGAARLPVEAVLAGHRRRRAGLVSFGPGEREQREVGRVRDLSGGLVSDGTRRVELHLPFGDERQTPDAANGKRVPRQRAGLVRADDVRAA